VTGHKQTGDDNYHSSPTLPLQELSDRKDSAQREKVVLMEVLRLREQEVLSSEQKAFLGLVLCKVVT